MADLKDGVGEGATNKNFHDVALVQALLRVIKDAKGVPYLAGNYDGVYGGQTKAAITRFQTDHKLIPPPAGSTDKPGFVAKDGTTIQKLNALLPPTHKDMAIIEGSKTVYLPGVEAEVKTSHTSLTADAKLDVNFRAKASQLVQEMYKRHKIALWAGPLGRHRTFDQQAKLDPGTTKAGPGESNHNFGQASDMVFKGLQWIKGDGTVVKDDPWLKQLTKVSAPKAKAFWDARDEVVKSVGLHTLGVDWDRPHVQAYDQSLVSMRKSLAGLLNTAGKLRWGTAPGGYKSDLGLGGLMVTVGTAKQIWAGNATVSKAEIVQALNNAKVPLDTARGIWTGKGGAKPKGFTAVKGDDVKATDISAVQAVLKNDFQLADKHYIKWKPLH